MSKISIQTFAKDAGVVVSRCDKEWGGTWQYQESSYPDSTICGFRTETELYNSWAKETFGEKAFKTLQKLIRKCNAS